MYLYYDKTGSLKEIINDEAIRQANYEINRLYIYIENRTYISVDVSYVLPSGLAVGPENYRTFLTKQIPFDPKRDLRFFKYYTDYRFLVVDLQADVNGNGPLDEAGLVHCSLTAMLEGGAQLGLGELNFTVQEDPTLQLKNVAQQEYLSLSDYKFLRSMVEEFVGEPPIITEETYTLPVGSQADVVVTTRSEDLNWYLDFKFYLPGGAKGDKGDPGINARIAHVNSPATIVQEEVAGQPKVTITPNVTGPAGSQTLDLAFEFQIPEAVITPALGAIAFSVNSDGELIAHAASGPIEGLAIDDATGQLIMTY